MGMKEVPSTLHTWSYLGLYHEADTVYPSLQTERQRKAPQGQGHTAMGLNPQSELLQNLRFSWLHQGTSLDRPSPGEWGGMSPGESR